MYFKITNPEENHQGLQYHDGLVEDILPFQKEGSCVPGGIYFSNETYICGFLNYGPWIREITIPKDAKMVMDPSGWKWRANKVILGERRDLSKAETWKWMVEKGVDIHYCYDWSLRRASSYGCLEIVKYLVENCADIHACDDYALRMASSNGQLEIVKYLVENGADIHVFDDGPLRIARANGYLDIV